MDDFSPIQLKEIKNNSAPYPISMIQYALTLFHEISCLFKGKEEARSENFSKTVEQKSRYIFSERGKSILTSFLQNVLMSLYAYFQIMNEEDSMFMTPIELIGSESQCEEARRLIEELTVEEEIMCM